MIYIIKQGGLYQNKVSLQCRRIWGGESCCLCSRGSNETPLQVNINDGGLKIQAANFQLLANSGGLENKL